MEQFGKNMEVHSWPRRSGKTGAAIMRCVDSDMPYYNPVSMHRSHDPSVFTNINVLKNLRGVRRVVIDNADLLKEEDWDVIDTMDEVVLFGCFGPIDGDFRMPSEEMWKCALKDVDYGICSIETALVDFNLVPRGYFKQFEKG